MAGLLVELAACRCRHVRVASARRGCCLGARLGSRLNWRWHIVWVITFVAVTAIAAPVLQQHQERYEFDNALKRDVVVGRSSRAAAEGLDSLGPACPGFRDRLGNDWLDAVFLCPDRSALWTKGEPTIAQSVADGGVYAWLRYGLPAQLTFYDYRLPESVAPGWPVTPGVSAPTASDARATLSRLVLPMALLLGLIAWSFAPHGGLERLRWRPLGFLSPVALLGWAVTALAPWLALVWLADPQEAMRHAMPWSLVLIAVLPAWSPALRQRARRRGAVDK